MAIHREDDHARCGTVSVSAGIDQQEALYGGADGIYGWRCLRPRVVPLRSPRITNMVIC